jgi:hypothetical protein
LISQEADEETTTRDGVLLLNGRCGKCASCEHRHWKQRCLYNQGDEASASSGKKQIEEDWSPHSEDPPCNDEEKMLYQRQMWGTVNEDGYFKTLGSKDLEKLEELTAPCEAGKSPGVGVKSEAAELDGGKKPTLQIDTSGMGMDFFDDSKAQPADPPPPTLPRPPLSTACRHTLSPTPL